MTTQRQYAARTQVAPERSVAEIQKLVRAAGATNWQHGEDDEAVPPMAWVQFKLEGWLLRFRVLLPTRADETYSPGGRLRTGAQVAAAVDQERRRRWREVVLLLKAKLVAVDSGVVSLQSEFLPYLVLQNDETVADVVLPRLTQLQQAARGQGTMPLLPPIQVEEETR